MTDQAIINWEVYEDAKAYLGLASAVLPDINFITQSISGAGIAGNVEAVIIGFVDAMTAQLKFRTFSKNCIKLQEPREHNIDLRVAQQVFDEVSGGYKMQALKHVLLMTPKSLSNGNVAPAATTDGSGSYAVRRWVSYIDGEKVLEIDPYNYICIINGVDYLADVRVALGRQ